MNVLNLPIKIRFLLMLYEKIFILTGEPSGDKLASTVISKLKSKNPNIKYIFWMNVICLAVRHGIVYLKL